MRLTFGPSLGTKYPPGIGQPPFFVDRGYIVDEPMVLHIDEAYILLSGARIVPEPRSSAMLAAATVCLLWGGACRRLAIIEQRLPTA